MKLSRQLLLGYLLVFAFMVLLSAVTYQSLTSLVNTGDWVAHTHNVIGKAHLIEKLLLDMETGERGFLITGEEEFLEPYIQGKAEYEITRAALKDLVSDNPSQVNRLNEIDALVTEWHEVAAVPEIEERRKVLEEAIDADYLQSVLARGVGKGILDEMRIIMDRLDAIFARSDNQKA